MSRRKLGLPIVEPRDMAEGQLVAIGSDKKAILIEPGSDGEFLKVNTSKEGNLEWGVGGGGGGGAESYVTVNSEGGLASSRQLSAGTGVTLADNGAGSTIVAAVDQAFSPLWSGTHQFDGAVIVDRTAEEAFLVRLDGDGGDVFAVDTVGRNMALNGVPLSDGTALALYADSGAKARILLTGPTTDATIKNARMSMGHYANAEEPVTVFVAASTSSANQIIFGGGSSLENAASLIGFDCAADGTTLGTGTTQRRMTIRSGGVTIGNAGGSPVAQLSCEGTGAANGLTVGAGETGPVEVYHYGSGVLGLGESGEQARIPGDLYVESQVGLGVSPHANIILDIIGGNFQQFRLGNVDTDATIKNGYMQLRHYTNAEQDVLFMLAQSQAAVSLIYWGGGSFAGNAATGQHFYTADSNTTLRGRAAVSIGAAKGSTTDWDEGGYVGIGVQNALARLHIDTRTAEGQEALRIDQDDDNEPFVRFDGTESADLTKNIATGLSGHGGTVKFIRCNIGGTDYWLMASTTPA